MWIFIYDPEASFHRCTYYIYICIFYVCGRVAAVFVAKQHSGGAMMAADADDEAGQFSGTYKYIRRYIYIYND